MEQIATTATPKLRKPAASRPEALRLRACDIAARFNVSPVTVWRVMRLAGFPAGDAFRRYPTELVDEFWRGITPAMMRTVRGPKRAAADTKSVERPSEKPAKAPRIPPGIQPAAKPSKKARR